MLNLRFVKAAFAVGVLFLMTFVSACDKREMSGTAIPALRVSGFSTFEVCMDIEDAGREYGSYFSVVPSSAELNGKRYYHSNRSGKFPAEVYLLGDIDGLFGAVEYWYTLEDTRDAFALKRSISGELKRSWSDSLIVDDPEEGYSMVHRYSFIIPGTRPTSVILWLYGDFGYDGGDNWSWRGRLLMSCDCSREDDVK